MSAELFDPADIKELVQLGADASSWKQNEHIDRHKLARAGKRARIGSWLACLRQRTGIQGITELQRVLEGECVYIDARGHKQHRGKWSGYQSRGICPKEELLLRVNLAVPGSYFAFQEPSLVFVSDERPFKYVIPGPPHNLPFAGALMRRDGMVRSWRDAPTRAAMHSLLAHDAPESLAYTCRFWLRSFELGAPELIPQIVSWLYGHLLINLMEYSRRGIAHEVLHLFDEKIFRCTEFAGRFPRLMPWLIEADVMHLHAAAILRVPRRGRRSDALRRKYMAAVILGDRLKGLKAAFEPLWEPPGPSAEKDPGAMDFLAKKQAAHQGVRGRLATPFWALFLELLRESGRQKAQSSSVRCTGRSGRVHDLSSETEQVRDFSSWEKQVRDLMS